MATDYPVRILLRRLQLAFYELSGVIGGLQGQINNLVISTPTVSSLIASSTEAKFVTTLNYSGTDGIQALWLRTSTGPDNGFDVRQSSADPTVFWQRIYVKE